MINKKQPQSMTPAKVPLTSDQKQDKKEPNLGGKSVFNYNSHDPDKKEESKLDSLGLQNPA